MTKSPGIDWTPVIVAQLRADWAAGFSTLEIPRRLAENFPGIGFSKGMVIGKVHRLHLPSRPSPLNPVNPDKPARAQPAGRQTLPPLPSDQEARVVEMLRNGRSNIKTAEVMGLSITAVRKVRAAADIPAVKPTPPRRHRLEVQMPLVEMMLRAAVTLRPASQVVAFPHPGRCQWLHGETVKTYRQCEATAVRDDGMRPPYSYCKEHRDICYRSTQQVAA